MLTGNCFKHSSKQRSIYLRTRPLCQLPAHRGLTSATSCRLDAVSLLTTGRLSTSSSHMIRSWAPKLGTQILGSVSRIVMLASSRLPVGRVYVRKPAGPPQLVFRKTPTGWLQLFHQLKIFLAKNLLLAHSLHEVTHWGWRDPARCRLLPKAGLKVAEAEKHESGSSSRVLADTFQMFASSSFPPTRGYFCLLHKWEAECRACWGWGLGQQLPYNLPPPYILFYTATHTSRPVLVFSLHFYTFTAWASLIPLKQITDDFFFKKREDWWRIRVLTKPSKRL